LAYEYDIFLSYPRSGQVGQWVHNHFLPVLRDCLDVQLAEVPRIFVDTAQPTGVEWPENIMEALLRSRLLVAVWTPPFFRSLWCTAEWASMLEREKLLAVSGRKPHRGLVYPVVYSDGKYFDPRANVTQARDLTAYTYPYPGFRESAAFLKFHDVVMSIAEEIGRHLEEIPDWEPDWPIIKPRPTSAPAIGLASL